MVNSTAGEIRLETEYTSNDETQIEHQQRAIPESWVTSDVNSVS